MRDIEPMQCLFANWIIAKGALCRLGVSILHTERRYRNNACVPVDTLIIKKGINGDGHPNHQRFPNQRSCSIRSG
jgi:hypothetical protein